MKPLSLKPSVLRCALMFSMALSASGCAVVGAMRGPNVGGVQVVTGLTAPVRVVRDDNGIPYIFASNTPDVIRAQGFVTAQHRLFQIEGYRAMANGRLAEAVGPGGLNNDRQIRLIGLRRNAERHARLLSAEARDFLSWYAQGMNSYIVDHVSDHPVELKLAGFKPTPWTVEDMVAVLHYINWSQAANFKAELTMQKLIDHFGADKALKELSPVNVNPLRTQNSEIVGVARSKDSSAATAPLGDVQLLADLGEPDGLLGVIGAQAPISVGSNNWVVGKSRTASGAAVMVNDPHLDARLLPGIWHPVGLFTPDIQVVGAAAPGVPGILLGRNAQTAFGVTNAYGDSQDLFVEQVAAGKSDHYVDGNRILPFQMFNEVIRIKDKDAPEGFREETMAVRTTVRGPIVSGSIFGAEGEKLLSLRMASAELQGGGIGIDRLLTAQSVADVDQAVQAIDVMYFNFVFADKTGALGQRASGRVPVRASGQGSHPKAVGTSDDWLGFIPPSEMPSIQSPTSDWTGTANHDTRPDNYPYDYSSYLSPSYRFRRMAEVLNKGQRMQTSDQLALVTDTHNVQTLRLKPALVAALKSAPAHVDLARILSNWDGRDDQNLAAPVIYHALYEHLALETFTDEMGSKLAREWLGNWYSWQERFDQLLGTPDSHWFDDTRTSQRETLHDLIRRSATAVRAELQSRYGHSPDTWRWGNAHRVTFSSPLRRTGIGRDILGVAPAPMSGSTDTLHRSGTKFGGQFDVEWFASARLVADLGDDEKVEAVVSGGVVDRQFHPHQKDQLGAWFEGRLLPWWFNRTKVEANARSTQELVPR